MKSEVIRDPRDAAPSVCRCGPAFEADLLAVVEGEDEIRPVRSGKSAVRTGLTLESPTEASQRSENAASLAAGHWLMRLQDAGQSGNEDGADHQTIRSATRD
jgi:hypothetical protein